MSLVGRYQRKITNLAAGSAAIDNNVAQLIGWPLRQQPPEHLGFQRGDQPWRWIGTDPATGNGHGASLRCKGDVYSNVGGAISGLTRR